MLGIIHIGFMENKKILLLLLIISVISCNTRKEKSLEIKADKALKVSLEYLLKNKDLPKEYLNQPFQIIQHQKPKIIPPLIVNGKNCIFLAENTNVYKLLGKMNLYEPIPLVEVIELKKLNNIVVIDLILRATGHAFLLNLEEDTNDNYKVIKIEESTI